MMTKQQLRLMLKQRRTALDEAETSKKLLLIADKLLAFLASAPNVRTIAGYYPIGSEIDVLAVMDRLAIEGYTLALPRIHDQDLEYAAWSPGEALAIGRFSIPQPMPSTPSLLPDVIITPLLGFDTHCNRIGYGGGYYDRTAKGHPLAQRIGLAYQALLVESIPLESHDEPLDAVITESGIFFRH